MAKVISNKKGFKIIEISREEIIDSLGRYGCVGICDFCGNPNSDQGYYIAVLNSWYCPECYRKWYDQAIRYPEDIDFEEQNFNTYRRIFFKNS